MTLPSRSVVLCNVGVMHSRSGLACQPFVVCPASARRQGVWEGAMPPRGYSHMDLPPKAPVQGYSARGPGQGPKGPGRARGPADPETQDGPAGLRAHRPKRSGPRNRGPGPGPRAPSVSRPKYVQSTSKVHPKYVQSTSKVKTSEGFPAKVMIAVGRDFN